ncbi:MAG: DUF4279 domain-containing protein [Eubacteriales bacterium]|nr:DUF4279 domain-containing protein [Eubacteriales bacterium]
MSNGKNTVNEARFSLIVQGDGLDVDRIESSLGLKATRMIRKGEELNRLPLVVAPEDEWVYAISLTEPEGADGEWNALLSRLQERREQLTALKQTYQVTLRMYVQSDYAQMAYQLMPETMEKVVAIGLPLNVSSLSWGEVGM